MVPNSVVLNVAVLPAARARGRQPARAPAPRDDPERPAGAAREHPRDAAARRAPHHARGARRGGGGGAHRGHAPGGRRRASAGERAAEHRLARDALAARRRARRSAGTGRSRSRGHPRSSSSIGGSNSRPARIRRAGSPVIGSPPASLGEIERNSSSTSPAASSSSLRWGPPSQSSVPHGEALAQLGQRRRQIQPPAALRLARSRRGRRSAAGSPAMRSARSRRGRRDRRAAGSPATATAVPDTMQASGSSLKPRSLAAPGGVPRRE